MIGLWINEKGIRVRYIHRRNIALNPTIARSAHSPRRAKTYYIRCPYNAIPQQLCFGLDLPIVAFSSWVISDAATLPSAPQLWGPIVIYRNSRLREIPTSKSNIHFLMRNPEADLYKIHIQLKSGRSSSVTSTASSSSMSKSLHGVLTLGWVPTWKPHA